MHDTASPLVFWGILALAVAMGAVLAAALAHSRALSPVVACIAVAVWMTFTAAAALSGVLADFDARPPPMAALFVLTIAGGVALGMSRVGAALAERVPLFVLVGAQSFRLPLELVMHEAAVEGTMPNAMSFSGFNFDIVTGALAVLVALVLARWRNAPRWVAGAFNVVGITLLAAIAVISFTASPLVRAFGDDDVNTFVVYFPFVWLPTVLVMFAIAGHVVLTRALLSRRR
jgi:hypothetical protein